jgi:hypothetical protein
VNAFHIGLRRVSKQNTRKFDNGKLQDELRLKKLKVLSLKNGI